MVLKQQQEQRGLYPISMPGVEDREVTKQPPLEKAAEEAGLQGRASFGKASSEGNVPRKGFDDD